VTILVSVLALPAFAQRVQSDVVLVRDGDVITEDLYAAGNSIIVTGVIEGDLVAVAFDKIQIDGVVDGDVILLSDQVEISGEVHGAVRVLSRKLEISGDVGDDVFASAWSATATSASSVGRDIVMFARSFQALGSVGRNIEGTVSTVDVGGSVGSDIDVTTSDLSLLPGLTVGGNVVATSRRSITVADGVDVTGTVVERRALEPNVRIRSLRLLARFLATVAALLIGLGILWSVPDRSLKAMDALDRRPFSSLAWGVGIVSVPVAILIVGFGIVAVTSLSTTGPLLLVLIPIALAVSVLVGVGLLTAPVPVALAVGARLRPRWSPYGWFVAGFATLVVVWLIPWVGLLLVALAGLAGLGSWLVD